MIELTVRHSALKLMLLGMLMVGLTGFDANAETVLRISSQLPPKALVVKNLQAFADDVAARTNGEIKVEVFHSAQIFKDKEVPKAVSSGAIQMGSAACARFVGNVPATDVLMTPFVFKSEEQILKALAPGSSAREYLDGEILKTGSRVLYWQAFGLGQMMSSKNAVLNPEDVKGLKVRTFGKMPSFFIKELGGAPVLMSGSEQFLAYQRGVVDAGMSAILAVKSRNLHQVIDHVTLTNHAVMEFVVIINEEVYQALTKVQQKALREAALRAEADMRDMQKKEVADARAWIAAETNVQVHDLTPDQYAAWVEATKGAVDKFLSYSGEGGRKVLDLINSL